MAAETEPYEPYRYHLDHPWTTLLPAVAQEFVRPVWIETGTNVGHGIAAALEAGATRVISIEADTRLAELARERFAGDARVEIRCGDSALMLGAAVWSLKERATIFLDAHSYEANPLLLELQALADPRNVRHDHTILIDDVRMFGTQDWFGITLTDALNILRQINSKYRMSFAPTPHGPTDLLVAQV